MPALVVFLLLCVGFPISQARAQDGPLGPKDQTKLPPTDTGRVSVGVEAPDFSLESLAGPRVTLSQFRGKKNVILVFYRGHW